MANEPDQSGGQNTDRKTDEQIIESVRKDPIRRGLIRAYDFVVDNLHTGFISSATSKKRKFGNGLSAYALITGLIGGASGLIGHFKADDFNDANLARAVQESVTAAPAPDATQCYYIDTTKTLKVIFSEYADPIHVEVFRAITQWDFAPKTQDYALGEIPALRSAACDALKDDQKLSGIDAEKKAVEIRYTFMQNVPALESYKSLKAKDTKGVFTFTP